MTVRGNPCQCGVLEAKYFQLIWLGFVNLTGSKITWETSHQAHLEVSDCDWQITLIRWEAMQTQSNRQGSSWLGMV